MGQYVSPSLIARVKEQGESDLWVHFLSAEHGWLAGLARGARRSRKRFVNCLDLFALSRLEYELRAKDGRCFIRSGKLVRAFAAPRRDFTCLSFAGYVVEMTEILFPQQMANGAVFDMVVGVLEAMDKRGWQVDLQLGFEARAMAMGGYAINLERCAVCGRTYRGEGRAVFKVSQGALACLKCEKEARWTPGLGPDAAGVLRLLQDGMSEAAHAQLTAPGTLAEVQTALRLHTAYHLGRRLRTRPYFAGAESDLPAERALP